VAYGKIKYEEVYLKAYQGGREARVSLGEYFRFYNTQRPHQALGYQTPAEVIVGGNTASMIESLPGPLRTAGPNLSKTPLLS